MIFLIFFCISGGWIDVILLKLKIGLVLLEQWAYELLFILSRGLPSRWLGDYMLLQFVRKHINSSIWTHLIHCKIPYWQTFFQVRNINLTITICQWVYKNIVKLNVYSLKSLYVKLKCMYLILCILYFFTGKHSKNSNYEKKYNLVLVHKWNFKACS